MDLEDYTGTEPEPGPEKDALALKWDPELSNGITETLPSKNMQHLAQALGDKLTSEILTTEPSVLPAVVYISEKMLVVRGQPVTSLAGLSKEQVQENFDGMGPYYAAKVAFIAQRMVSGGFTDLVECLATASEDEAVVMFSNKRMIKILDFVHEAAGPYCLTGKESF